MQLERKRGLGESHLSCRGGWDVTEESSKQPLKERSGRGSGLSKAKAGDATRSEEGAHGLWYFLNIHTEWERHLFPGALRWFHLLHYSLRKYLTYISIFCLPLLGLCDQGSARIHIPAGNSSILSSFPERKSQSSKLGLNQEKFWEGPVLLFF